MHPRSPHEGHRVATPLELLFDLVFVVAVGRAAAGLHHAIAAGHALEGLMGYGMVFFAIWWAWMNFTWFASAYDCDDVPYRLLVFVQLTGALVMAAGITVMFEERHPTTAVVAGYVLMRISLVVQWLRAAAVDPVRRRTALRYAAGIAILQVAWIALLFIPVLWRSGFVVLMLCEVAVPVWAERAEMTPWHPHHIAERYGLLTLIVLGESILSATGATQDALESGQSVRSLLPLITGGLLTVFSLWWVYFDRPAHDLLTSLRKAIFWGYGHYVIFAAAAAIGAGLAVAADQVAGHTAISRAGATWAVAIPAVIYLDCLWIIHYRPVYRRTTWLAPAASIVMLAAPFTSQGVLVIGITFAVLVAIKVATRSVSTDRP